MTRTMRWIGSIGFAALLPAGLLAQTPAANKLPAAAVKVKVVAAAAGDFEQYRAASPYSPTVVGRPVPNPSLNFQNYTLDCAIPNQNLDKYDCECGHHSNHDCGGGCGNSCGAGGCGNSCGSIFNHHHCGGCGNSCGSLFNRESCGGCRNSCGAIFNYSGCGCRHNSCGSILNRSNHGCNSCSTGSCGHSCGSIFNHTSCGGCGNSCGAIFNRSSCGCGHHSCGSLFNRSSCGCGNSCGCQSSCGTVAPAAPVKQTSYIEPVGFWCKNQRDPAPVPAQEACPNCGPAPKHHLPTAASMGCTSCSSWESETVFLFGSCKQFFGQPTHSWLHNTK